MTTTTNQWLHLQGCHLPTDHHGPCLLHRPFRIRPENGREHLGGAR